MDNNKLSFGNSDITKLLDNMEIPIYRRTMSLTINTDHLSLAQALMEHYNFTTMNDTGEIYIYHDGVYLPSGQVVIQKESKKALACDFTTHRVNEIINSIKYSTYVNRTLFDSDPNILNLENGLLDIETMEFKEHTSRYLSLVRIPVVYNSEAKCPCIEQFFKEVLNEADIPLIEEMFGYCLLRQYKYHKAFMMQGDGRNGKSTLLNLLQRFLGSRNCSNTDLSSLCNDRFASSQLFGKLANIFSDLPAEALKATGKFKALVGGDRISAERKFQHGFEFTNYAKLIFSCNYVPITYDLSPAFFSRWIIIRFPNTFNEDKANPNLLDELTTEEELSGLLNLSIAGLKRLLENGKFSYNKSSEETADEYQRLSNPVSAFIDDRIKEEPEDYVVKDELYNAFKAYCKKNGYAIYSEKRFTEWLKREVSVEDYRPSIDGQQKRAWRGIKLLPSSPSFS